ncbi:membrane protein [[Actinobacillus] muris]|uniref:Membrane protein n=1 Tax=Muribacter muris TaxID=67855 RepID=A0A0J5P8R1_9PAST|nr:porin family protein [Muribacter muris]KMK51904.1 membrane protein [[Actinobacillus] muris] [Muribacter muris]MBF0784559.1 porin family protein [Muribacter muris]MBF0826145.1 porin family protein [Muribacter muris]TFV12071.1 porin family protein [Muribacter muris]
MKKLTLAVFTLLASNAVLAAPVGETFSGLGVGVDLTTVKYKSAGLEGKQATGANLVVDYGMDYGDQLVGVVEAKAKLGSTKIFNDVKQKSQFSVAYEQGYRVLPDLMPYAKVNYSLSKVGDIGSFKGIGYGAGAKYAVSNDIELGVEYLRSHLKHSGTKLKGNAFSTNVSYRF